MFTVSCSVTSGCIYLVCFYTTLVATVFLSPCGGLTGRGLSGNVCYLVLHRTDWILASEADQMQNLGSEGSWLFALIHTTFLCKKGKCLLGWRSPPKVNVLGKTQYIEMFLLNLFWKKKKKTFQLLLCSVSSANIAWLSECGARKGEHVVLCPGAHQSRRQSLREDAVVYDTSWRVRK